MSCCKIVSGGNVLLLTGSWKRPNNVLVDTSHHRGGDTRPRVVTGDEPGTGAGIDKYILVSISVYFDFATFWIFQIRSIKHHPTPQHRGSHLLIKSFTLHHPPGAEEKQVSRHPPGLVWCNLGQAMASHGHLYQCNVI